MSSYDEIRTEIGADEELDPTTPEGKDTLRRYEDDILGGLLAAASFKESEEETYGVTFPLFTVASAFENEEKLTAKMTLDTWYELDGTALLDGSRKLNAQITEEEI